MREIHVNEITNTVAQLCIKACVVVAPDIRACIQRQLDAETGTARQVLEDMLENQDIATRRKLPICQDTGMAVVFLEIGQDVRLIGGNVADAVHEGVRRGYDEGFLRKSVVADPIKRVNTKDNTPAVIHYDIVPGDGVKITVAPKGFGSENMSRLRMFVPADGLDAVEAFVLETVTLADANPCPPIIVGVGVGGTFDYAANLAKRALLRKIGSRHPDDFWADTEARLLEKINATGIGPGGFGGRTTAMAVHIGTYATHIAGLPVAVNIGCHVNRHEEAIL
ncbi:MAG: fumarate hydratase [Clostridiales bacterium]|jgi:fumarate hydratase subunit alpha|nr:fumarate hydratase [Clostridiales bacterium]